MASAAADTRLTDRIIARTSSYYEACNQAEEKIAQMEAQLKEMDAILMQPDHATDMKLIEEYAQTMRQLDEENDRWMQLSEELEALQ